jgi:outer membrane immunogenic protein
VILVETKVQRFTVALITIVVLGLAYASGALAADMSVTPPPDCSQMGKAPPDFVQIGKAPPDCSQMGMGKAPPAFLPDTGKAPPDFMQMGKAPPPMTSKSPLLFTKAPPLPPPPSWTGFYVGGDAGAAWLSDSATWNPLPSPAAFGEFPISGNDRGTAFIGGAHVGYNDQVMPDWVVGLEGDWSWSKAGGSVTQPWIADPGSVVTPGSETTMNANLEWIAAARGRIGYLVTPDIMAYATGGAAWAKMEYSALATNNGGYFVTDSSSSTRAGYVAGGGVEWLVTDNWSVRAEYLYYQFAKGPNVVATQPSSGGLPSNFVWGKADVSVAQAGLSYKF